MVAKAFKGPVNRVASLVDSKRAQGPAVNVSQTERWAMLVGGGALAILGLTRESIPGLLLAGLGGAMVYRGLTGHCNVYGALDINTADHKHNARTSIPAGEGVKVERSITINRPVEEVFRFWRNFENLPRVMSHLETVKQTGGNRSHWVAKGPAGVSVEWDAEIITERPNELIGWRSLDGSTVATAGSVHFQRTPGNRATQVHVVLKYEPPAGKVGAMVAKLFGRAPEQEISADLGRLKTMLETGVAK